jgi:hypothetical protein
MASCKVGISQVVLKYNIVLTRTSDWHKLSHGQAVIRGPPAESHYCFPISFCFVLEFLRLYIAGIRSSIYYFGESVSKHTVVPHTIIILNGNDRMQHA